MNILKMYVGYILALFIKIIKARTLDLAILLLGIYPTDRLIHM